MDIWGELCNIFTGGGLFGMVEMWKLCNNIQQELFYLSCHLDVCFIASLNQSSMLGIKQK
jgi:hypothetical protein